MTTSHNTDPFMPVDGSGSLPPGGRLPEPSTGMQGSVLLLVVIQ